MPQPTYGLVASAEREEPRLAVRGGERTGLRLLMAFSVVLGVMVASVVLVVNVVAPLERPLSVGLGGSEATPALRAVAPALETAALPAVATATASSPQSKPSPGYETSAGAGLYFIASNNDYPAMDNVSLALYKVSAVVEPHRITHFTVYGATPGAVIKWTMWRLKKSGDELIFDGVGNSEETGISYEFKHPTAVYHILLEEWVDGVLGRKVDAPKVICKYIRREIRDVNTHDLEQFMNAMVIWYDTPHNDGIDQYGEGFYSAEYMATLHNTNNFCYHGGSMFLTSHPSLQLMFEKSLRMIEPNMSTTPYWDFMLDVDLYGESGWASNSPIFSDDLFGPVSIPASQNFELRSGRFAGLEVFKDGPFAYDGSGIGSWNSYGFVQAECDNTDTKTLQRSTKFCGMEAVSPLGTAGAMIDCFKNSSKAFALDLCLEQYVHGSLHEAHGGAWDCAFDFAELNAKDPEFWPENVLGWLGTQAATLWFKLILSTFALINCPMRGDDRWPCEIGDSECAKVISTSDVNFAEPPDASLTDGQNANRLTGLELYTDYGNTVMLALLDSGFRAGKFIAKVDDDAAADDDIYTALGAQYKWRHLPAEQQEAFTRWVMLFAMSPGKTGSASSQAAANDPLFWIWHQIFDRMTHVLRLSPIFQEGGAHPYDLSWANKGENVTACAGGYWLDHTPFKNLFYEVEELPGNDYYREKGLWGMLSPTAEHLPYVYDHLQRWGMKDWTEIVPEFSKDP